MSGMPTNVVGDGGLRVARCDFDGDFDHPEARANATLITAAPDLLEALVGLMAAMDSKVILAEQMQDEIDAARAAIDRAQGGTKDGNRNRGVGRLRGRYIDRFGLHTEEPARLVSLIRARQNDLEKHSSSLESEASNDRGILLDLIEMMMTQQCRSCNGRGTTADYIGLEMKPVEVECDRCSGTGRAALRAATGRI